MFPQLTTLSFDRLARLLPEPCRRYIFSDPRRKQYDGPEDGAAYNEPCCQWLLGCWDAVLLPKCTQWITQASVNIDMGQASQPYQTACLIHALSCMVGVTQLSLLWNRRAWEARVLQYHPPVLSLWELTAVLPKLASLHVPAYHWSTT